MDKNNVLNYNGYSAEIQFSSEDECLVGHILNINDIVGFHGNSVEEVKNAFVEAVDFYIQSNNELNKHTPENNVDKIVLNIPKELHKQLYLQAQNCGETLDEWILKTLNESIISA